jgi:25S rRNA (uracil2634-N3)-methyltransferase
MGKTKRGGTKFTSQISGQHRILKSKQTIQRRQHSQLKNTRVKASKSNGIAKAPPQPRQLRIPFTRQDTVLLVGEGDFSFALALLRNYRPAELTATCYDAEEELLHKYPSVRATITKLTEVSPSTDAGRLVDEEDEWLGFSGPPTPSSESPESQSTSEEHDDDPEDIPTKSRCRVLYGIDATKLSSAHRKRLTSWNPFSKIVFNFPHTGGLSTDVNRQVRANQQLLVGFFNSAKMLLVPSPSSAIGHAGKGSGSKSPNERQQIKKGQILVTLFEGEPYSLWNVRDLARHCGLQVIESFKIPWEAYPGYKHARTAGDITTGKERPEEGKRKGAWRGEERDARCYVLELKDNAQVTTNAGQEKRKVKAGSDDESD